MEEKRPTVDELFEAYWRVSEEIKESGLRIPEFRKPTLWEEIRRRWLPMAADVLLTVACGACVWLMTLKMRQSGGDLADNIAYLIAMVGLVIAMVCGVRNMRYHYKKFLLLPGTPMRFRKRSLRRYCSNVAAVAAALVLLTVNAGYSKSTFAGVGSREIAVAGIDYIMAKQPMARINTIK